MKAAPYLLLSTAVTLFLLGAYAYKNKRGNSSIVIGFGGDTMLGRLVNKKIAKTSYAYPWGNLLPELKKTDLNIVNLETTLTTHKKATPKVFNFRAEPDRVQTLLEGNIAVVSLANNHILDFGAAGLQETIAVLDQVNIKHIGAGKNLQEAKKPVILNKNGITIGIIGATDNEPDWKATSNSPGTFYFSIEDPQEVVRAISDLKKNVDVVIISLHWGPNMRQEPTPQFRKTAHKFINAGADIIHGHSAHIFQGIERYKDKIIMYDTGDLVDDYRVDPILKNNQSVFFTILITKKHGKIILQTVELTPLLIDNMQVNKATGKEKQAILEKIQSLSIQLGPITFDNHMITVLSEY